MLVCVVLWNGIVNSLCFNLKKAYMVSQLFRFIFHNARRVKYNTNVVIRDDPTDEFIFLSSSNFSTSQATLLHEPSVQKSMHGQICVGADSEVSSSGRSRGRVWGGVWKGDRIPSPERK